MDLIEELEKLEPGLATGLAVAETDEELETLRIEFLGRKGRLANIMSRLVSLSPEERPKVGQIANRVKERCQKLFATRKAELDALKERDELARFDPSMPGRDFWEGTLHPVTLITEEICDIFIRLGYNIASGPEVEIDRFNFEALNIPPDHPARDMHDTLYISDTVLLRTHTSPVQARTMLAKQPPLAVIAPGKVYRRDSDLTHTPMFHQIEGLRVGANITMGDLRGTLLYMAREVFGRKTKIRFRPSYFPFTEPSAEADISCAVCQGAGELGGETCRVCKGTGWVEILGCGMVDPAVYEAAGYPPDSTGFAFGLGVERIAMLKYGINDLRLFFENDIRFLKQFGRLI
ncbi:MAG: phenylalanine--tRNA ligase subunit alpha [Desulfovibrio sp.]|nr:phenylalanine--tRNA ligase subunit alpha [Desulfovibrio sp.]